LNADKDGKIGTYIVFPPIIHGESVGPIRALGIIQLLMREKARELGFIPCVGEGSAITNSLHVKDVTRFMLLVLSLSLRDTPHNSVYERCFIIGGLEMPWKTVADAFAKALHAKGLTKSPKAKMVSLEDAGGGEIPMLMASDMRFVSHRAERLGYQRKEVGLLDFLAEGKDIYL
jgi:nucleoside-diphosphate-sugar epimerase